MDKYVLIFTARRIICVEEIASEYHDGGRLAQAMDHQDKHIDSQFANGASSFDNGGDGHTSYDFTFERIGNSKYKHWNIFFDDIMKLRLDLV